MIDDPIYGRRQRPKIYCPTCRQHISVTPVTAVYRLHNDANGAWCPNSGQPAYTSTGPL